MKIRFIFLFAHSSVSVSFTWHTHSPLTVHLILPANVCEFCFLCVVHLLRLYSFIFQIYHLKCCVSRFSLFFTSSCVALSILINYLEHPNTSSQQNTKTLQNNIYWNFNDIDTGDTSFCSCVFREYTQHVVLSVIIIQKHPDGRMHVHPGATANRNRLNQLIDSGILWHQPVRVCALL